MIWKLYLQNKKNLRLQLSWLILNPKVLIQEFVWSLEILIVNVLDKIYSLYFDYIISMSVSFKIHLFCQNQMYNCGVIGVES